MHPLGDLLHNQNNAVTARIARIRWRQDTAVEKVLNGRNSPDVRPEWRASHTPSHWNYWQREQWVYASDLNDVMRPSGVRLADVLDIQVAGNQQVTLVLEDVHGRTGTELTKADYERIAHGWGHAQANIASRFAPPAWASRDFLRSYALSKPVDYALLRQESAWQVKLIADNWPDDLRPRLANLYAKRQQLWEMVSMGPRVLCHLDFWPHNIIVADNGDVVPVDWSFFGIGTLGEDISNFILDAVFDEFMPAIALPDLTQRMFAQYVAGLQAGGRQVDVEQTRQLMWACGV